MLSSLPRKTFLAIGVIVLLCLTLLVRILESEAWVEKAGPAHLTTQPERVVNNPYTDWFLVWQKQEHSHTLVVATTKSEDVSWLDNELADLTKLKKAVYVVDDDQAQLRVPANKGNEAMVYITYILDFYDELPDVSTFMHSHRAAWHNGGLLARESAQILHALSLEKVVREGYVNLRCELDPGCPISVELERLDDGDTASRMNRLTAKALQEMLPDHSERFPPVLAQPCCAQFAVSRDMIHRHSKQYYRGIQQWLLDSDMPNQVTGRILEYLWHYIFTTKGVFCPSEQLCWCDTYAICFPTAEAWHKFNSLSETWQLMEDKRGQLPEGNHTFVQREELRVTAGRLRLEIEAMRDEAFELGKDPLARQRILFDAWELLKSHGQV